MAMVQTCAPGEFPVPVVRTLPMGEACASEADRGPGCRLVRHAHARACLVPVRAGIVDEVSGRQSSSDAERAPDRGRRP